MGAVLPIATPPARDFFIFPANGRSAAKRRQEPAYIVNDTHSIRLPPPPENPEAEWLRETGGRAPVLETQWHPLCY